MAGDPGVVYKLWGREPALWLALISSTVMLATAFGIDLSNDIQSGINATSAALFGLLTSWFVARDGLQAAILGFAKAGIALAIGLGLDWSPEAQSGAMFFLENAVAMFVR